MNARGLLRTPLCERLGIRIPVIKAPMGGGTDTAELVAAVSEAGEHHLVAEEYAVLDRVGRLQLPRDYVDALGLQRRVRLVLEGDHIAVWPDRDGDDGLGGAR